MLRAYLLTAEEKVDDALTLLLGNEPAKKTTTTADRDPESGPETVRIDHALDLSGVTSLREEGKKTEAAAALLDLLTGELVGEGFVMK